MAIVVRNSINITEIHPTFSHRHIQATSFAKEYWHGKLITSARTIKTDRFVTFYTPVFSCLVSLDLPQPVVNNVVTKHCQLVSSGR